MKRLTAALLMTVPFLLFGQDKAPKMVVEAPTFDAGEVMKGTVIDHDFIIKNQGDAVLKILSARPG